MITRIKNPGPTQTTPFWSGIGIYDAINLNELYFHTLNVERFPLFAIASQYLATYMLTNQPDIIVFQEVKDKYLFALCLQVVNEYCKDFQYKWWFTSNRVYRSNLCICYKDSLASNIPSSQMNKDYYFNDPYVLRPPVISDFYVGSDFIRLINIHAIPTGATACEAKRDKFYDELSDYVTALNSTVPIIIFGDFNISYSGILSYFDGNVTKIAFDDPYTGIDYALTSSHFSTLISSMDLTQKDFKADVEHSGLFPDWATDFSDHYPIRLKLLTT